MTATMSRLLGPLLLALTLLAAGFMAGDKHRNEAWLAKQAVAERAAAKKYQAEVVRGDAATATLIAAQRQHTANYQHFESQFNELRLRAPLLVRSSSFAAPRLPAGPISGLERQRDSAPFQNADSADASALSTGAVWMWNTALAGSDQPAGSCSALDTTTPACSAATEVTLNDAWDNHSANAEICTANKLAHQQLIDFLTVRTAAAAKDTAP